METPTQPTWLPAGQPIGAYPAADHGFRASSTPSNIGLPQARHSDTNVSSTYGQSTLGNYLEQSKALAIDSYKGNNTENATSQHSKRPVVPCDMGVFGRRSLHSNRPSLTEDDIFSTVGGLELGHDVNLDHLDLDSSHVHHPQDPAEPSRTLLVRNVASTTPDEELHNMFQSFGDVRTLYTASKHRSLVVVSYYDHRAAVAAFNTLQGTLVHNSPLEIHYSSSKGSAQDIGINQGTVVVFNLDPDTTNEHLVWLFSKFGDVKDISESPSRQNQKFISFYDIRHAAAALKAMNRAEQLGKLPAPVSPQQPSTGSIQGASPTLLQYAAQLHADGSQPHAYASVANLGKYGTSDLASTRGLHVSDSASSIASVSNSTGPFFNSISNPSLLSTSKGVPGPRLSTGGAPKGMHPGLPHNVHLGSSISGGFQQHMYPQGLDAGSMYNNTPAQAAVVDQQAQQLLMQSGMSYDDAANMLLSLNLSADSQQLFGHMQNQLNQQQQQQQQQHVAAAVAGASHQSQSQQNSKGNSSTGIWGNGLYGSSNQQAMGGMNLASLGMTNVHDLHARQQQQQQQQQQLALASQLAGLQAQQQALFAAAAAAQGNSGANLTAAQILQAAGLSPDVALATGQPAYLGHQTALAQSTAAQLLQQAGLGVQNLQGLSVPQSMGLLAHGVNSGSGMPLLHLSQLGMRGGHGPALALGMGMDALRSGGGRLSRRTHDPGAEAERKAQQEKLYALDLHKIRNGEDRRTTLMIKNIPNKYTQKMLLATIDEHFRGTYDFFYLPIDFKNKCNVGYAFINMIQPVHIIPLVERFNNKKWERFNSEKVCNISYARIQGRGALVAHFQNSSLMHEDKRCRPILFTLDGAEAGEQEPFPSTQSSRSRISQASAISSNGGGMGSGNSLSSPAAALNSDDGSGNSFLKDVRAPIK